MEAGSVQVAAGATITVEASALGAPDNAFLMVYNGDSINTGNGEVHFL